MEERTGSIEFVSTSTISYANEGAKASAELLAEQLRPATGFAWPIEAGEKGTIVFQTLENPKLGKEGYVLEVGQRSVRISALASTGLFYGAQTLRQLHPPEIYSPSVVSKDWKIPAVEIRDFPTFGWRGVMLDVSRHFFPPEDVKKFIDTLASLKINVFHWHLTDDQGWRIEIKKYPKLTQIGAYRTKTLVGRLDDYRGKNKKPYVYDNKPYGGFYTQDEIRDIVRYAADRHVEIIPEIDMPGHMQAAIAAYPELGCTNAVSVKTEWGSGAVLNPEDSTVLFCQNVLSEVMDLFPSKFIHIGGDEVEKGAWNSSKRIQQLREERGLKDMDEMQDWFIQQMDDFLSEHNRRLVGWDEIASDNLSKDSVVMWWHGRPNDGFGDVPKKVVSEGYDMVNAANPYFYFDYYQSRNRAQEPIAIGNFLPVEKVYKANPFIPQLKGVGAEHVLGIQGELWTEYISGLSQLEYMAFPRVLALAELGWSNVKDREKHYPDFVKRVKIQEKRFDCAGVNYRDVDKK